MKLVLVTLALAAAPAVAFAPHVPESDEPTVSPTSYPTVKPTIKEVECVDAGCAEHPQCNKTNYDSGVVPFAGEDEVYLSGHYLRIGVNAYGTFGTYNTAGCPAPECTWNQVGGGNGGLGLEQDTDGFGVCTPSPTGDFFLPGSPYYQFCIGYKTTATGSYITECNDRGGESPGFRNDLGLASTTDASSGGNLRAEMNLTFGPLKLESAYSFDVCSKKVRVDVHFENVGSAPIYDVAYTIGVDPDQDVETLGTYDTKNSIEGQMSQGDNFTAVCAEGALSGISMCLTTDIATSYAFHEESFFTNVIATEQPIGSAFIPPKGTTTSDDTTKNLMTIQEGALAVGETSGNLGMYLGLGVKDDIVEPENEICE